MQHHARFVKRPSRGVTETKNGRSGLRGAGEKVLWVPGSGNKRFEKLAHAAEREVLLEIAAASSSDKHVAVGRGGLGAAEQTGFAYPRRSLEHGEPTRTLNGAVEHRGDGDLLGVAFEEFGVTPRGVRCHRAERRRGPRSSGSDPEDFVTAIPDYVFMSSQPPETPEAEIPEETLVSNNTEISTEKKAAELLASFGLLFDTPAKSNKEL